MNESDDDHELMTRQSSWKWLEAASVYFKLSQVFCIVILSTEHSRSVGAGGAAAPDPIAVDADACCAPRAACLGVTSLGRYGDGDGRREKRLS